MTKPRRSRAKMHYMPHEPTSRGQKWSPCGHAAVSFAIKKRMGKCTSDFNLVTCEKCIKILLSRDDRKRKGLNYYGNPL